MEVHGIQNGSAWMAKLISVNKFKTNITSGQEKGQKYTYRIRVGSKLRGEGGSGKWR